jgi:flagellar M-ring protein FliF
VNGHGPGEFWFLTDIVRQAVGFDEARGDTISVVNSAFQPIAALATPDPPAFYENPAIWSIARQVLGAALVLALAYFVLRPMMQVLTRPQPIAPSPSSVEYAAQLQPLMAGRARDGVADGLRRSAWLPLAAWPDRTRGRWLK